MKVLFCDPLNTQNSFYTYAKHLRQKGIDAQVVIGTGATVPKEHLPGWHDTELNTSLSNPDWIVNMDLPYFLPFIRPIEYLTKMRKLVKFANTFDVIGCSGLAPMWMRWSKKPFVLFSYGSDIDQMATQGWSGESGQKFGVTGKIVNNIVRRHLVSSMRRARATVIAPYQLKTAEKLGLTKPTFMPHLIDTELFNPLSSVEKDAIKRKVRDTLSCDLIMFHPPRQAWTDRNIADCKGNDLVFKAFARFLQNWPKRAKLISVNKGWDLEKSKKLVEELGIQANVVWIDPVNKAEMGKLYNTVDIVLDQFVVGVLALVALEPLACETPSVSHIVKPPNGFFYPEMPPVVEAMDEDSIYNSMMILANDPQLRVKLGVKGRAWVEKYCSPDVSMSRFIELFEQVLGESKR